MRRHLHRYTIVSLLCGLALTSTATADDHAMDAKRRWVDAKFAALRDPAPSAPYLIAHLKSGRLLRNRIKDLPLLIVDQKFESGLALRSPGEIEVEIPSGTLTFEAIVGVDSNDVGYYSNTGRGSVIASVEVDGRQRFATPVLHEGMKAIPVKVDLNGARQFSLKLKAVGDRPPTYQDEWDQSDWAEARVTLMDGRQISLSDLPSGSPSQTYSIESPFSFVYGGRSSTEFLKDWPIERNTRRIDDQRTEYTSTYTDPATHLTVRCVAIAYTDFPTVEWTVYFRNNGSTRTPILENIKALDTQFEGEAEGKFLLHHSKGSREQATDFQPIESPLAPKAQAHFASIGGRPTDGDMPYFNLEWEGRGVIFALGWPGQWALNVSRDDSIHVQVAGGQELTHFWLAPGEEVRTPLAVVQFWDGDWVDGQNFWRRWMIAHNTPHPGGKLPPPQISGGSNRFTDEMQEATEQNQIEYLKRTLDAAIPIDYWWMDAGWYQFKNAWWDTGTWDPDPKRFPHGFGPISDYAHSRGVKIIVWFEPERVTNGSWLANHHPDWLIGPDGEDKLLFLGNHDAWQWLVDHLTRMIADQGIDVYRQDFNFEPLPRWRSHDTSDRQGITEIEHVEGYLAFLDELHQRFPKLLLDTCASGGRRLDLETLRRAVPLWRSDYPYEPTPMQMQTFGLSLWDAYFGTAVNSVDPYYFRSQMNPALGMGFDPEKIEGGRQRLRNLLSQWREVADYYYGDFIPLTPYSTQDSDWMAWQFNRPDGYAGTVQAFRRGNSPFTMARFKLRGLDPTARYAIKDLDSSKVSGFTGKELMGDGLPVSILQQPGSIILTYMQSK